MCVDRLNRRKTSITITFSIAGALGLPWQTQCNEAMPWKGKHDLISHVYLQNVMIYMVIKLCLVGVLLGFLVSSCCFTLERNIFCHDFGTWCLSFSRKRPRRVPSKKALSLKTVFKDCHQTSPKVVLKWWLSLKIVIKHRPKFCWSDGCL